MRFNFELKYLWKIWIIAIFSLKLVLKKGKKKYLVDIQCLFFFVVSFSSENSEVPKMLVID